MNQLSNIQFVCDDATEFMKKLAKEKHKVDVVIMDPQEVVQPNNSWIRLKY